MHRFVRYSLLGIRILMPSFVTWRQVRLIRRSGLFDRAWYIQSNPRLPCICRWLPERHYLLVGEKAGLCPSPGFSPKAYLYLNPDLPRDTPALTHYITTGKAEGRAARDLPIGDAAPALPLIGAQAGKVKPADFAVVLHLHYREMWEEIADRLEESGLAFDLFVTLTSDPERSDAEIRTQIRSRFRNALILNFPNHGRDILPFLHLLRSGLLSPYRAICKIHSKKSPHRQDGDHWRDQLISGLLTSDTPVLLASFLEASHAGMWVADGNRLVGEEWWGPNRDRAESLIRVAGLDLRPETLRFAAGSMFWLRPPMSELLAALPVAAADFEPEMGQVDGTTAHALERLFGLLATGAGFHILETGELRVLTHSVSTPEISD